ncbi:MAG: hypothetical protein M0D55_06120 [Elusimicrobiota bacterium]|nr:MAG: hypothetical protein M0D55_06120 [Elusimicrobiota bacterium]
MRAPATAARSDAGSNGFGKKPFTDGRDSKSARRSVFEVSTRIGRRAVFSASFRATAVV